MPKKYLPIQFFEKRKDFDDRSTEGGGDSRLPSWVLTGVDLSRRSTQLVSEIGNITVSLRQHKQSGKKIAIGCIYNNRRKSHCEISSKQSIGVICR